MLLCSSTIKGQLIYPTGGGKTLNMIMDAVREFSEVFLKKNIYEDSHKRKLMLLSAPRILLAEQLSSEFLGVYHYCCCVARP
jgi:hypothetical protein